MYSGKHITCIVTAAGSGSRFGAEIPKQFLNLDGSTVLETAIQAFEKHKYIDGILVTLPKEYLNLEKELKEHFPKIIKVVPGGETRQESVSNALKHVSSEIVLVHDSARPYVSKDVISRVVEKTVLDKACVPVIAVTDTIRNLEHSLNREELRAVQTPQGFFTEILKLGVSKAKEDSFIGTDDASLVERLGYKVSMVLGDPENIKITVKSDLKEKMEVRVGTGYDVHRLVDDRKLILLGVDIPNEKGLLGHSDADVATHALMDALLGAASLGDIGRHFPDKDPTYLGISSLVLLKKVKELIDSKGFKICNVDITIICEKPKIAGYMLEMRKNISRVLDIEADRINIKGTTTEGLGFTGRGEGIASSAVATLERK